MAELFKRIKQKVAYNYLEASQRIEVIYRSDAPANLKFESGTTLKSSCINCSDESCINLTTDNKVWDDLRLSQTNVICPTDAIYKDDSGNVCIDDNCIGCGLCVSVCPIGAIYLNDKQKATLERDLSVLQSVREPVVLSDLEISYENVPIIENEGLFRGVIANLNKLDSRTSTINRLVCKALQVSGVNTFLTRVGDVNMRMDGVSVSQGYYVLVEVEIVANLDSPRDILDDVAVFCSRNGVKKDNVKGMIILPELPNKRTEFWELLSDIKNVLDLEIMIVPLAALLSVVWNKKLMNIFLFNLNKENTSARSALAKILEREPNLASPSNLIEAAK